MGYAGYAPSKLPPDAMSEVQKALKKVPSDPALETLSKLVRNVAQAPKEDKYRKIRLTNEKIKSLLVDNGAVDAMKEMGWEHSECEEYLVLPPAKHHTMADVRTVDAARDGLKEAQRLAARKRAAASKPLDPEKERIRQQMMADRAERASRGPVTQGSTAQQVTSGTGGITQGKYEG